MASFGFEAARAYALAMFVAVVFFVFSTTIAASQTEEPAPEAPAETTAGQPATGADAADIDAAGEDGAGTPDASQAQASETAAAAAQEGDANTQGDGEAVAADGVEEPAALEEPVAANGGGRLQPVFDLVDAGGPVIVILGFLSVISLAVIVVKIIQFTALRVGDHKFVEKIAGQLKDGEHEKALEVLTKRRGVTARVMETALRGRMLSSDETHVREEVERVARAKLDGLERGLPLLSLVATISPLLGLLGTVLGMIEAFQQLENAGDRVDPAILSGGIWEALLTTAAGLSVAIPAAAFFTWLQRSVEVAGQHMEDAATRVFTAALYQEAETARRSGKTGDKEAA